jgi:NTP pyrophosphatase (non-canonical NTP hydrolase)
MKRIIESNYDSIVKRGLISPQTTKQEFIDKLFEEVSEVEDACLDNDWLNIAEELADVILTALNFAKHYDIDIELELNQKININYERGTGKAL